MRRKRRLCAPAKAKAAKAVVMQDVFIAGRSAVTDAMSLVDEYGPDAPLAAAMRAVQSRDAGNVLKFCHWRQIERLSALLASNDVQGSLH